MPAVKWRPVDEMTRARASPLALRRSTISGSSCQNSGTMVLSSSGLDRTRWATPSATSTSKQRCAIWRSLGGDRFRLTILGHLVELLVLLAGVDPVLELDHADLGEPVPQPGVA